MLCDIISSVAPYFAVPCTVVINRRLMQLVLGRFLSPLLFPVLLLLSGWLTLDTNVSALIPDQCIGNVSARVPVCCPVNPHNGQVCGGPHRGYCQQISVPDEEILHQLKQDDRLNWPIRFFSYACQCIDNYFGVSCDECWLGWHGPNCDHFKVSIKRDLLSLPHKEVELFKNVLALSQHWPSGYHVLDESTNQRSDPLFMPRFIPSSVQYYITFMHRYGARATLFDTKEECDEYNILNFNHDGVVFPTWHRYFNLVWERLLGQIAWKVYGVKDFVIPYWDFVGLRHCDICTDRYIGGPGMRTSYGLLLSPRSPFHNFTQYCPNPEEPNEFNNCYGCQRSHAHHYITREFRSTQFPDQRDVEYLMSLRNFFVPDERSNADCVSFHMALEGFCGRPGANASDMWMHNKVHRMIDGSMCCTSTSTNDPIFIVLHNFIDKLFNIWLRLHKVQVDEFPDHDVRPGHTRDSFIIGLLPLARNKDMFVDSRSLGYDFDDALIAKHADNMMPLLDFS